MRRRALGGVTVAVALLAAACGTDDGESAANAAPPSTDHDDHDDHDDHEDDGRHEEHDTPHPRLAIISRDEPQVHVIDLESGELVDIIELSIDSVVSEGVATTEAGRHLLVGGPDDVNIVDIGSWSVPHGDHAHYYTTAPSVVGEVAGPSPTHLISHGGVTAMYFDGSGEAIVIDDAALADHEVAIVETVDTGAAHHGFAVPIDGSHVVTWPYGEEVLMPDHVAVLDESHELVAAYECEQTHGEASFPGGVAAACQDGILVVHADGDEWHGDLVTYPDVDDTDPYGYGNARAWMVGVDHTVDWGFAVLGTEHLMRIHFDTGTAEAHEMGEAVVLRGVGVHGATGAVAVLTHDGRLRLLDLDNGEVLAEAGIIEPFPVGDPAVPTRSMAVSGDLAWVVDPEANLVIEIDLADGLAERQRWELDFSPAAVTVHGQR